MPIGTAYKVYHRPANDGRCRRVGTLLAFPMRPITHDCVEAGGDPESGQLTCPPSPAMLAPSRGDRAHAYRL
jgi:hypothetical protein